MLKIFLKFRTFFLLSSIFMLVACADNKPNAYKNDIFFVKPQASGTADGSSWQNAAKLQTALNNADNSIGKKIIFLAKGVHRVAENAKYSAFIVKSGVKLYGGFDPENPQLKEYLTTNYKNNKLQITFDANEASLNRDLTATKLVRKASATSGGILKLENLQDLVIIDGLLLENNSNLEHTGGAAWILKAKVKFNNINFKNLAAKYAGAVYLRESQAEFDKCNFENVSSTRAGTISSNFSQFIIKNSKFTQNYANYGSAIYADKNSSVHIIASKFTNNLAREVAENKLLDNSVGTIYINRSSVIIENSDFTNNKARNGAGLFNSYGKLEIINSNFNNNAANIGAIISKNHKGGAIFSQNSTLKITNSTIAKNSAVRGAGIYSLNDKNLTMDKIIFKENANAQFGGAAYIKNNEKVIIKNSAFVDNNTQTSGAGIYSHSNKHMTIANSTFKGNRAKYGGGIYTTKSTNLILTNLTLSENIVTGEGGGFYINSQGEGKIYNSIFYNNKASHLHNIAFKNDTNIATFAIKNTLVNSNSYGKQDNFSVGKVTKTSSEPTEVFTYENIDISANSADKNINDTDPLLQPFDAINNIFKFDASSIVKNSGSNQLYQQATGEDAANAKDQVGNKRLVGNSLDLGAIEAQ